MTALDRDALATRQREVLADLLRGQVPPGFDPAGAAATTRILHRKRSSAVAAVAPELTELPHWRHRFHTWAAEHPAEGCAHTDVRRFAESLGVEGRDWLRYHEVCEGTRRFTVTKLAGRRVFACGIGSTVWLWGRGRDFPG